MRFSWESVWRQFRDDREYREATNYSHWSTSRLEQDWNEEGEEVTQAVIYLVDNQNPTDCELFVHTDRYGTLFLLDRDERDGVIMGAFGRVQTKDQNLGEGRVSQAPDSDTADGGGGSSLPPPGVSDSEAAGET